MNAVPIYEAKNKLPFFIHKAESEGPVPITRHNKEVAFIISKEDYESMVLPKSKSVVDRIREQLVENGFFDDGFDFSAHLEANKEHYYGRPEDDHIFDEV